MGTEQDIRSLYQSKGVVEKRGDKDKEESGTEGKDITKKWKKTKKFFVYTFCLMDLVTKMYICFGTGMRSEKEAFDKAMEMLKRMDIDVYSTRLDKYYGYPGISDSFSDSRVYIIPKKNTTLEGSQKWKREVTSIVRDTIDHLREYFKRCNSESGFSSDKRRFCWVVRQKRSDRIDTALFSGHVLRNLLLVD